MMTLTTMTRTLRWAPGHGCRSHSPPMRGARLLTRQPVRSRWRRRHVAGDGMARLCTCAHLQSEEEPSTATQQRPVAAAPVQWAASAQLPGGESSLPRSAQLVAPPRQQQRRPEQGPAAAAPAAVATPGLFTFEPAPAGPSDAQRAAAAGRLARSRLVMRQVRPRATEERRVCGTHDLEAGAEFMQQSDPELSHPNSQPSAYFVN
jgi:hypothetical protein